MGLHTIQFTWNITLKERHSIMVTRIGHIWTDTLEVALDGKTIAARTVGSLQGMGLFVGQQQLNVDGSTIEMRWKYNGFNNDPESIVLISENKIIAQYGSGSAAKSVEAAASITPDNLIALITSGSYPYSSYVDWNPIWKWYYRVTNQFGSPALPPVTMVTRNEIDLRHLGMEMGFHDESMLQRLDTHSKQLKKWRQRVMVTYFILIVLLLLILYFSVMSLISYVESTFFLILLPAYFLSISLTSISLRLAYQLSSKIDVETLSVATILYVLAELKQEDALIHPDKKQVLLARMRYLAKMTVLLAERFQTKDMSPNNQVWVDKHFCMIESYIQEHQRWMYAPIESTLPDLRRDLSQLAGVYISGLFGAFNYQVEEKTTVENDVKPSGLSKVMAILPKLSLIVFGIILPTIGLFLIPAELPKGEERLAGMDLPLARSLLLTLLSICVGRVFNVEKLDLSAAKASSPAAS